MAQSYLKGPNYSRPSFFELNASDYLFNGLRPAFRNFTRILTSHSPRWRFLDTYADEWFSFFMFALERNSLHKYGGRFCEEFYALRRGIVSRPKQPLKTAQLNKTLLWFIIFEYVFAKMERYYDEITMDINSHENVRFSRERLLPWLRRQFVKLYPILYTSWHLSMLLEMLGYLSGKSPYHHPLNRLLRQIVRRYGAEDMLKERLESQAAKELKEKVSKRFLTYALYMFRNLFSFASIASFIRVVVKSFLFGFRGLEWFFEEEGNLVRSTPLPIPPPPPPSSGLPAKDGCSPEGQKDFKVCPMCKCKIQNPALVNSGHIFCYRCIFPYFEKNGKCPVTLKPINTIRRVFP
jgi:hypothetical protein